MHCSRTVKGGPAWSPVDFTKVHAMGIGERFEFEKTGRIEPEVGTIQRNIAMRQHAQTIIDLASTEAGQDQHFWSLIRDHAIQFAPMPQPKDSVRPMDDSEARGFGRRTLGFGVHRDKRYDEVPLEYLEWLADQNLALRRYLASRRVQREADFAT